MIFTHVPLFITAFYDLQNPAKDSLHEILEIISGSASTLLQN